MYCKLFASLYQGTLRGKPHEILVFTNMLAHCDKEGYVDKHFRAIADEVGLSLDEVRAAVTILESPDDESRSPEEDGRRIIRVSDNRAWGWRVVNYGRYRAIKNDEDRREQNRKAQEKWRNSKKEVKADKQSSAFVIKNKPIGDGDGDGDGDGKGKVEASTSSPDGLGSGSKNPPTDTYSKSFDAFWAEYPKKKAKGDAWKAWKAIKGAVSLEVLIQAIRTQKEFEEQWQKDDGQFIPFPATWLRSRSWENEYGNNMDLWVDPDVNKSYTPEEIDPLLLWQQKRAEREAKEEAENQPPLAIEEDENGNQSF